MSRDVSEILMTNEGKIVEEWLPEISKAERLVFSIDMLRQVSYALKKLHDLGFSHGDLKPENICARRKKDGSFVFTLIDLGMAARLPK